ncbi:hypothetical protein C2E19_19510 [Pseudomonas sp. DTU12.3]|nr:hypothetical protein C2E19_19510 [Pseudomonas sp. DTU12.3]
MRNLTGFSRQPRARIQRRFTPRHRRIVGLALLVGWAVGLVVHPGQYLLYPAICGIITLFSSMDSASK